GLHGLVRVLARVVRREPHPDRHGAENGDEDSEQEGNGGPVTAVALSPRRARGRRELRRAVDARALQWCRHCSLPFGSLYEESYERPVGLPSARTPNWTSGFPQLANRVECRDVLGGRLPLSRDDVRPNLLRLRRARDHRRNGRPAEEAADRDAQKRHTSLLAELLERLDPVERLVREDVVSTTQPCPFGPRLAAAVLARQQAARQREVRKHADAEPFARREQLRLHLAPQQRVLVLGADGTREAPVARQLVDLGDVA